MKAECLAVISTHPVQYHAPVYREVQRLGLRVTAVYGSDFSVAGYHDREFGATFSWSTDLLTGYSSIFLSRTEEGGALVAQKTSARGLGKALERVAPDAVLLTGYSPAYLRYAALRLLVDRRRILFRAETTDHARKRSWLKESVRDLTLQKFYGQCSALLYIGLRSRAHFDRLGIADRQLFFSPYCVDASAFEIDELARERLRTSARADLGLRDNQTALVFSGKLVFRKGPDLLVDAVRSMPRELKERLVIMWLGEGGMRDALASQSGDVTMRFIGFQNQHQLSRFYHAADALVLPSRSGETWGLVVNEALMHGLPCIVSEAVGCGPDLVVPGETGEVFAANSASSLRDALLRILGWHHGAAENRERCRRQVRGYSVEEAAKGIVAAFEGSLRPLASGRATHP